jgi:hypothetical protein
MPRIERPLRRWSMARALARWRAECRRLREDLALPADQRVNLDLNGEVARHLEHLGYM